MDRITLSREEGHYIWGGHEGVHRSNDVGLADRLRLKQFAYGAGLSHDGETG